MRRRLMGGLSIKATLVSQMDTIAGDVCFYNSETDSKEFYRLDTGDDHLPVTCTPIGVVVIPASHDVYGDGSCGVIGLTLPKDESGNLLIATGSSTYSYSNVPIVGNKDTGLGDINSTITAFSSKASIAHPFQSDYSMGTCAQCVHDETSFYYNPYDATYAPSPYLTGDLKNPNFAQGAFSDFNKRPGINSYTTEGTNEGDWYFATLPEIVYSVRNIKIIESVFSKIRQISKIICSFPNNQYIIYSSTGSGYYPWKVNCDYYTVFCTSDGMSDASIAFLRVPPPINYGPIQLTGGSISDIPASGGTSGAPTGYTYTQTWGYGNSSTNGGIITSGAEISYTTVTADSLGTTITNRAKVGDSVLTITMNGVTQNFDIPVYQSANRVTKIESKIDSFRYNVISNLGGTSNPISSTSYIVTYTSESTSTTEEVSISNTYSGSVSPARLNSSSGALTWSGPGSSIFKATSVQVTKQTTYSYKHSSDFGGEVITGTTATVTANCQLAGNYITKISLRSNNFSYDNIGPGDTSATPTSNHTLLYTLSNLTETTSTPSSTYGTLTVNVDYTLADNSNGFTNCNSNGRLTVEHRGTTIGNARTSSNIVKSINCTWTPNSGYGNTVTSGNMTKSATCTQEGNYVTDIESTTASLSYPKISAGATSATPSLDFGDVKYTFSSGSTSTTNPGTAYGTYSGVIKYNLQSVQNGFTSVNSVSGVLTATSRGTTIGNERESGWVDVQLTMSWTPTDLYNSEGTKDKIMVTAAKCTQSGNYVTTVTPLATSGYSSHFTYDSNIGAGGGTVSPTGRGQATYTFSSGATTTSGSTSWTNAGTTTFSRTYSGTLATGFTSIDPSSGAVTASSRGTTQGDARSQSVSSTLTVTFTHNSTYSAGGTKSGTLTQSATCTQSANNSSMTSVRIVAYQPDNTWLATSSWGSIPAGGHYLGVYGYYCYTWSSGSTSETAVGNLSSGLTYTTSMAEVWKNGGLHILSRGTSYSASTRSGTVYWTYNGLKSNTLSFTQNANTITITSVTSSPGSLTGATFAAGGQTKDITATAASASAVLTYSSGSTVTTNYNATDYGTWTFHGYTGSSNQTYVVVNSTNYDKMSISMTNNTSTAARSATITRKEAGFTFTLNSTYGGANKKSTGTQCTCTVTQSAGAKQYGSWTGGAVTFSSTGALSAGADSRTVTIAPWTRTWGWNSTSGGGTETYTGSVTLSENGSYTSLNVSSYTASGSNKTATLTKSTCGTTDVAATTVTVTAKGATTTTGSLSQNANGISSYGAVSVSSHGSASDIPASGGTKYGSGGSGTQTITYSSGSTRAGSVTCGSYSGVTASSLGTTLKDRTKIGNSTATLTGEGSKTASVSVAVYQQANTRSATSTSGGSTTYGNVTAGTITNKTIPASGGSATATAGNGSQTWSKSAVVTTYTYTSGSTKNETTTAASSGTNTISPSVSSYTASANSKGTTVSAQTTVGSKAVTWSGSGGKSASGTMYVYQAANSQSTVYNTPLISSSSISDIPASGGTFSVASYVSIKVNQTAYYTYTSGSNTSSSPHSVLNNYAVPSSSITFTGTAPSGSHLGTTVTSRTSKGTITLHIKANGVTRDLQTTVFQQANTQSITYGTPSVSLSYSGNVLAAGGTKSPSYSYSQTRSASYTSGSTSTLSNVTSGGSLSFSETTAHSAATVNSSTGVVSWSANTSTSTRSCGVTLTVTLNGKSGSKAATCTQAGNTGTNNTLNIYFDKTGSITSWEVDTYHLISGTEPYQKYSLTRQSTDGPITISGHMRYDNYAYQILSANYGQGVEVFIGMNGQFYLELDMPQDISFEIYWNPAYGSGDVIFDCS